MVEISDQELAEAEIRRALSGRPGVAATDLFAAYARKSNTAKDAFVAALITRVTAAEGLRRTQGRLA